VEKYFYSAWKNTLLPSPGKNSSGAHASDCIKVRNHTLLDFLHRSRKRYIFFHKNASKVGMLHWTWWVLILARHGRLYRTLHPKLQATDYLTIFCQYLVQQYFAALDRKRILLSDITQDLSVLTDMHVPILARMLCAGTDLRSPGPRPSQMWPIWPFVWKAWKYAPLMCSAPSKYIFCCADFGSTIALDLQQKLKPYLHSSK